MVIVELMYELDIRIASYISDAYGLMQGLESVYWTLFAIVIAWMGFNMIGGRAPDPWDAALTLLKMMVIYSVAFNSGEYMHWVANPFMTLPDSIASSFLGAEVGSEAEAMNDFWDRGMKAAGTLFGKVGVSTWSPAIMGFIVFIFTLLALVVAFVIIAIAKIGTAIMLALGYIMLLAAMVGATRGLFEGWLRLLMGFMIARIIVSVTLSFLLSLSEPFANDLANAIGDDKNRWAAVGAYSFGMFLTSLVLAQVPSIASTLGGGIALHTLGYAQKAQRGLERKAGEGAEGAAKLGGKAGGAAIGAMRRLRVGGSNPAKAGATGATNPQQAAAARIAQARNAQALGLPAPGMSARAAASASSDAGATGASKPEREAGKGGRPGGSQFRSRNKTEGGSARGGGAASGARRPYKPRRA